VIVQAFMQDGSLDVESAPQAAANEVELLAVLIDKQVCMSRLMLFYQPVQK